MRLEVSGGRPNDSRRVRRVFALSPLSQTWLSERLHETPELARRLSRGHPDDLIVVGRRDELPALRRLLDAEGALLPPELAKLRGAAVAAAEAEQAAVAASGRRRH